MSILAVLNPGGRKASRVSDRELDLLAGIGLARNPRGVTTMARRRSRRRSRRVSGYRRNPSRKKATRRKTTRRKTTTRKSSKRSAAGRKGARTKAANKVKRSRAAKKAARTRKRKPAKRRTTRRRARKNPKRRKRRARRNTWKGQPKRHRKAARKGVGRRRRKRKGTKSYRYRKSVKKYARNPKKRRRTRKSRRNPSRRRTSRRRSYRRNPALAAPSIRSLKSSVMSMFKTGFLKQIAEVAAGGAVVGVSDAYLSGMIDERFNLRGRIAGYAGGMADKVLYVYDKAFTLALSGLLGYLGGYGAKKLGAKPGTCDKIRNSLVLGGAMLVAVKVVNDVVGIVAARAGFALP